MTLYNVHIYREMRLFFPGIEAPTPEKAAATARELDTADADDITSCDGETLAALVDVAGDDQYEQSVSIDFEAERLRKAAPELLQQLVLLADHLETRPHDLSERLRELRLREARAAIARATADDSQRRPA